jgi:hypothetical protein
LALNRDQGCYTIHIAIKDLHFGTRTLSRPTWHYAKASRSQHAQCPIVGTEIFIHSKSASTSVHHPLPPPGGGGAYPKTSQAIYLHRNLLFNTCSSGGAWKAVRGEKDHERVAAGVRSPMPVSPAAKAGSAASSGGCAEGLGLGAVAGGSDQQKASGS